MNNLGNSPPNFLEKLDAYNKGDSNNSSDTLVLCTILENEKEKKEEKEEKHSYFSFKNHRSKSCIIL